MQLSTTISSICISLLSIATSFGVVMYDGQFAQLATEPVSGIHDGVDVFMGHAQHVHTDYNPTSSMLSNSFHYQSPSIAPRRRSHHKELLRMLELGGRHLFDDAHLPVTS